MTSYRRRVIGTSTEKVSSKATGQGVHYLRVSSVRQTQTAIDINAEGNSIATQREECDRKASAMGVTIAGEFVEPGKSAQTIEKRPEFRRLLAYLAENPDIDYVFVYARSRAFRNVEEAIITRRHLRSLGVKIISTKEDFGDSLEAEFMEVISDTMNDLQNKRSGEDIKMKMAHKARNGGTIGRAPIGYRNARVDIDGRLVNTVVVDTERAPIIRTLFELYASGDFTAPDIAEAAEDMGLRARPSGHWKADRPLSLNTIYRMLGDPYYTGRVMHDGELFDGRHEAIVEPDVFARAQEVLETRSANGTRHRRLDHYLKGSLYCGVCEKAGRNSRMIFTEAKGQYGYYVCTARVRHECDSDYLRIAVLERAVLDHYSSVALAPELADSLAGQVRETVERYDVYRSDITRYLNTELRALDEREDRLVDALEDDDLPRQKVRERLNRITIQRESIRHRLAAIDKATTAPLRELERCIVIARDLHTLYASSDDDSRRKLNQALFNKLWVDQDGRVEEDQPAKALAMVRTVADRETKRITSR